MNTTSMSASASKPPPLWLVTNGETTVGPVNTNLLVRGVLHDMIPSDCLVRESHWTRWRNVETIREIVALRRAQARHVAIEIVPDGVGSFRIDPYRTFRSRVEAHRDPGAVLTDALLEAVRRTGACVGAVHRRRTPYVGYVTSSVVGPGMMARLGHVLPKDDAAIGLAKHGVRFSEEPRPGLLSGRIAERLGSLPACASILMMPVSRKNGLEAIIELGRPDHPFRDTDDRAVNDIVVIAATRLDELWSLRAS